MKVKQRRITLLEVVISLGLISILLGALFSIYSYVKGVEVDLLYQKERGYQTRYLEGRLGAIFLEIPPVEKDKTYFYTDSNSLVLSYQRGSCIDPLFDGEILGRLYLDGMGRLIFTSWPPKERWKTPPYPEIKEVLMEGVEDLSFTFFVPPKKDIIIDTPTVGKGENSEPESNKWHPVWYREYERLPPLVRIKLKIHGEEVLFTYHLANNSYPLECS
ncbi:type II secretion system GspH family protein [Chlamydiales bacterium]|nr:type II secretion system GspH family protein [Chlamydiales bacterium]